MTNCIIFSYVIWCKLTKNSLKYSHWAWVRQPLLNYCIGHSSYILLRVRWGRGSVTFSQTKKIDSYRHKNQIIGGFFIYYLKSFWKPTFLLQRRRHQTSALTLFTTAPYKFTSYKTFGLVDFQDKYNFYAEFTHRNPKTPKNYVNY